MHPCFRWTRSVLCPAVMTMRSTHRSRGPDCPHQAPERLLAYQHRSTLLLVGDRATPSTALRHRCLIGRYLLVAFTTARMRVRRCLAIFRRLHIVISHAVLCIADSLRRYFSVFGKISAAQVMYNRETCKSRGFGFVIFEDEASVDRAVATRMHVIDEKAVRAFRTPSRVAC